jgi:F5/8 type C domain-containing protein
VRPRYGSLCAIALAALGATGNRAVPLGALDAARWIAAPADGVELRIAQDGDVLRLDFDFHGRGGWAAARLPLELELPDNWALGFELRAAAPANHLEIKFVDPSGESVWWSVKRDYAFPTGWTPIRVKKRQVKFAWGPAHGGEIHRLGALEMAITAGSGGRGTVWLRNFALSALPPDAPYAGTPTAAASAAAPGSEPGAALDGNPATFWQGPAGGATWTADFGSPRELGGLTFHWQAGGQPARFAVELSDDGRAYRPARSVTRGGGGRTDIVLPDAEARFVRLAVPPGNVAPALAEMEVQPLAFAESANAPFEAAAREAPRGDYPRGFSGEQVYWTVVGLDGGQSEILFSEDGAAELGVAAPALEPFLASSGRFWSWADTTPGQRLADGDLPIPSVDWQAGELRLEITALATGEAARSRLALRYRLRNPSATSLRATLFLAARPFQVNPPTQFLNQAGGVAKLTQARCTATGFDLDARAVAFDPPPARCGVSAFDEGSIAAMLRAGTVPPERELSDELGYASAAVSWTFELAPGAEREVVASTGLDGAPDAARIDGARFAALEQETRAYWRERLDRVGVDAPAADADLVRSLRTGLAAILIHRDGPAIQPGSRAYARSWIRDGALTGSALLRLGATDVVREFADWYAGFQYPDGKVPCCVDRRGADPVPENDSHGEWIHLVREVWRYGGDRAFAERLLPSVERAVGYLDRLRGERRTAEYGQGEKRIFYGLLPQSISHEGYSEKPMHSYWDDAFGYLGYDDAQALARELSREDLAARWRESRDAFRADLVASIALARSRHGIDFLPGAAELGDFDATSTTVFLDPTGLADALPRDAVEATFTRYQREFRERRDGQKEWDVYTPYELRAVGAFVRLGWRDRAHELLAFFRQGRRPAAWNQWAEVVFRELRKPRFLGDLPHGWVASDFARSFLDLYAYERRGDGALVLAAGIPRDWLAGGEPLGVRALRTPWGPLTYSMLLREGVLEARIEGLAAAPPRGVVFAPPIDPARARVTLDGQAVPARSEIALGRLPARVVVESPW